MRWVSYGCLAGFALERFAYHVFDLGTLYHKSPMTWIWLMLLPLVGYSLALFRSPLLSSRRRSVRGMTLGFIAILLTIAFFYCSLVFFRLVVFSRVQWW
jgi:hypothetical protein